MTKPLTGLDVTEKMLAELEADRIEALSEEELRAELRASGIDPDRPVDVDRWMAEAQAKRAAVVPLPARRRSPMALWTSIAAVAACVAGLVVVRDVLSHHDGGGPVAQTDAAPPPTTTASSEGPSVLARATQLRDEAQRACDRSLFGTCEQKLDDAKALDPSGERDPNVAVLRARIQQAKSAHEGPSEYNAKPLPYQRPPARRDR